MRTVSLRKNELVLSDWGSIVGSFGLHIYYFQSVAYVAGVIEEGEEEREKMRKVRLHIQ